MTDLYKKLIQENPGIDEKSLWKVLKGFESPKISVDKQFKKQLDKKLTKKIQEKEELYQQQVINTVPNFVKWRFRLTGFMTAMCAFLFVFILSFFSDFFSDQISVPSKYQYVEDASFVASEGIGNGGTVIDISVVNGVPVPIQRGIPTLSLVDEGQQENIPYRFLYDGKKYPKLDEMLSVYKRGKSLINNSIITDMLARLKVGDVSLKGIQNFGISHIRFYINNDSEHVVSLDVDGGTIHIYDDRKILPDFSVSLSDKQLRKAIITKLKEFWISLSSSDLEIQKDEMSISTGIYNFSVPLVFDGKLVYDPLNIWTDISERLIWWSYNMFTHQISFSLDVASYQVSNYSILSSDVVMNSIETWGDYFHWGSRSEYAVGVGVSIPQEVYVLDYREGGTYYIPALKFDVNMDDLLWEDAISTLYVKLVDF